MAFKTFAVLARIVFLLAISRLAVSAQTPSPFEFLKGLEGCKRGDRIEGIRHLKMYLKTFGYLSNAAKDDDFFDDLTEPAIRTYQQYHNLKVTGRLDAETVALMMTPRCGVPDIFNDTARTHVHGSSKFHAGRDYAFFPKNPKWPPSKPILTYAFPPGTRTDVKDPIWNAFTSWAAVTNLAFNEVERVENADIKISFQSRDHGDGHPFDGPKGILAHAYAPTDGRLHYDADEKWVYGAVADAFDMATVGLHELGHVLGLAHSTDPKAIMYPYIGSGLTKALSPDDIQGIQALYT